MWRWIALALAAGTAGFIGRHLVLLVLPLRETPIQHGAVWKLSSVIAWLVLGRWVREASTARTVTVGAFSALGGAVVLWLLTLAIDSTRASTSHPWSFHALYLAPLMAAGITFPISFPPGIGMAFAARRILGPPDSQPAPGSTGPSPT